MAIYMWGDLHLCPTQGLEVLQMMSLININKGNESWTLGCMIISEILVENYFSRK